MKNKTILVAVLTLIIGAGVGFFGGMKYQQSQIANARLGGPIGGNFAGRLGTNGRGGTGTNQGFRPVSGQIIAADAKTITVKLSDGSSKIVFVSATTDINKADKASTTDLTVGQTVAVFGMSNSDGSVTAQTIQLNPVMRLPDGSPSASPSAK